MQAMADREARSGRRGGWLLGACIVLLSAVTVVVGGPQVRENSRLAFHHGSPYIRAGGELVEVFTLYPKPESPLALAGVWAGDIVVSHTIREFYKLLHGGRGTSISITVVDGGDGPPLAERTARTVEVQVPQ